MMRKGNEMQQESINKYKEILIEEKERLETQLKKSKEEEKLSQKESTGELSSYDNHPGDNGTATFDREMDQGIKDNSFALLKQVNDALSKIESGKFGFCQKCGEELSESRLEVVPYSSLCEKCKKSEENMEGTRERPMAEETFFPPFRGFNDDTDNVEYDAEDTWQDLAQYGTSSDQMYGQDNDSNKKTAKESYVDSEETVGSVGKEDSIIDADVEDIEETGKTKTTFTGIKGDDKQ